MCIRDRFAGLKFTPKQLKELRYAALLHDIGKIAVPEAVLDKQNKLLDSEIATIQYRLAYAKTQGRGAGKIDKWIEAVKRINVPRGLSPEDKALLAEIAAE